MDGGLTMKSFTDAKGKIWTIEVNVTTLQRVKGLTGIDLTKLIDAKGDTFTKVVEDVFVMFEVLTDLLRDFKRIKPKRVCNPEIPGYS